MYIFITILILIAAILMILIVLVQDVGRHYHRFKYINSKIYHFEINRSPIAG